MSIHYHCRYCGTSVGILNQTSYQAEILGFHKLTEDERMDMIQYDTTGDVHVKCICEDCQESFLKNPRNYENEYIIH